MEEKKTWWERKGWIAVGGGIALLLIVSYVFGAQNNTAGRSTATPDISSAPQNTSVLEGGVSVQAEDTSTSTVVADGITYNVYSLAELQTANLMEPGGTPVNVETTGTITQFIAGSWMMITDGNGNYALVLGNNGTNSGETSLMSGLNVGDTIVVNGFGSRFGTDNYSEISSIPPSTPVVIPTESADSLIVTSTNAASANTSWQEVFSYMNPADQTRVVYGNPDTPSFTVDSQHWRIQWRASNYDPGAQGTVWTADAWLVYQQDDPNYSKVQIFDQQMANGSSASGTYNGVGEGTYYVNYILATGGQLSFTVEELQ